MRLHLALPNLMVGLGIFGTFWGLSASFGGLSGSQQNAASVMSWVNKLQGGMGTAFLVSMCGMGASIVHIAIEKWFVSDVDRSVTKLVSYLNRRYLTARNEEFAEMTASNKKLEQILLFMDRNNDERIDKVVTSVNNLPEQINQLIQEVSDEFVADLIAKIDQKIIQPVSNRLNQSLAGVGAYLVQLEQYYGVIESKTKDFSSMAQKHTDEIVAKMVSLSVSTGRIGDGFLDVAEKIKDITSKTSSEIVKAGEEIAYLQEAVNNLLTNEPEYKKEYIQQISLLSEQLEKSKSSIKQELDSIFKDIAKIVNENMTSELNQRLSGVDVKVSEAIQSLATASNAMKNMPDKISGISTQTLEQINQGLITLLRGELKTELNTQFASTHTSISNAANDLSLATQKLLSPPSPQVVIDSDIIAQLLLDALRKEPLQAKVLVDHLNLPSQPIVYAEPTPQTVETSLNISVLESES